MKRMIYQGREYMLFGIPDKVIIQNGEIEILDFKFSDLNDPPKKNKGLQFSNSVLSVFA